MTDGKKRIKERATRQYHSSAPTAAVALVFSSFATHFLRKRRRGNKPETKTTETAVCPRQEEAQKGGRGEPLQRGYTRKQREGRGEYKSSAYGVPLPLPQTDPHRFATACFWWLVTSAVQPRARVDNTGGIPLPAPPLPSAFSPLSQEASVRLRTAAAAATLPRPFHLLFFAFPSRDEITSSRTERGEERGEGKACGLRLGS